MLRRALAVGAVMSVIFAVGAGAEEAEEELPFADARSYIQFGGTNAVENFDFSSVSADSAVGFNIRWGKRVQPHFSVETQFEYLGDFEMKSGPLRGNPDIYNVGVNVKGFPLTGRIQPFVVAGFGGTITTSTGDITSIDSSGAGFSTRFGGGLDLYATESLALSLEAAYVIPTGEVRNYEHLSVGWSLVYRFASEDE